MNSYLRQDIVAEPLINRWYATAYLVSPMTAPLMVANGHLPTMRSFASAPMIHVNALKNPEMQGGAYIAHGPERVEEIKSLIAATQQIQAPLLSFAEAVKELDRVLAQEAKGFSLEPLYAKVPAPLKGYVELTYDLQCQPAMRFVEGLLYHSPVYQKQSQAIAMSAGYLRIGFPDRIMARRSSNTRRAPASAGPSKRALATERSPTLMASAN